jgi:hypothetical protein
MSDAEQPITRTVRDDGGLFKRGDVVNLIGTPSDPPELHLVKNVRGRYEVLKCAKMTPHQTGLLTVTLRTRG